MEKKKILLIGFSQAIILTAFILLAAGSSKSSTSSETQSLIRAGVQGGTCGALGYTYVGNSSDCYNTCKERGYSDFCTGSDTYACFCKWNECA